uniref:Uncharacterized protein n=1 Tax=Glossina morsitans morsitans TaxID=37546 RepID=A0A1B0GD79_GLOMM
MFLNKSAEDNTTKIRDNNNVIIMVSKRQENGICTAAIIYTNNKDPLPVSSRLATLMQRALAFYDKNSCYIAVKSTTSMN